MRVVDSESVKLWMLNIEGAWVYIATGGAPLGMLSIKTGLRGDGYRTNK